MGKIENAWFIRRRRVVKRCVDSTFFFVCVSFRISLSLAALSQYAKYDLINDCLQAALYTCMHPTPQYTAHGCIGFTVREKSSYRIWPWMKQQDFFFSCAVYSLILHIFHWWLLASYTVLSMYAVNRWHGRGHFVRPMRPRLEPNCAVYIPYFTEGRYMCVCLSHTCALCIHSWYSKSILYS